jgi:hypothetical protein
MPPNGHGLRANPTAFIDNPGDDHEHFIPFHRPSRLYRFSDLRRTCRELLRRFRR